MKLPRRLRPPELRDEEQGARALLVHVLLWTLVLAAVLYTALVAVLERSLLPRAAAQAAVGVTANFALLVLLHRGHLRAACVGQVTAFWLFITVSAFTGYGTTGVGYQMGYPLAIVFAGLLLEVRGALVVVLASLVAGALMVALDVPAAPLGDPHRPLIVSLAFFPVIAVAQYLGQRQLLRALARAKESETRLRTLNDAAFEGIMTHEGGVIRSANTTFAHLFGYDRADELLGLDGLGTLLAPESADSIRQRITAGIDEPQPFVGLRRDGTSFHGETRSRVLQEHGRPVRVVVVRDVSAQVTAEAEREALYEKLAKVERLELVGRVAGGIAHDFNNLLTGLIGHLTLVLMEPDSLSDDQRDSVEQALEMAQRGARLTRRLLAIGRRQRVSVQDVDLRALIERSQPMLARLLSGGDRLQLDLGDQPAVVGADPGQVDQVLANLCLNARDAISAEGRVRVALRPHEVSEKEAARIPNAQPGAYVVLEVEDDGVGMTPEVLSHLFEPFFTTKNEGKGTGLGLSSVYGIVRQHGGFVLVTSEKGRGSTFQVYWPAAQEPPATENDKPPAETPPGQSS